jgi:hypothetical protein
VASPDGRAFGTGPIGLKVLQERLPDPAVPPGAGHIQRHDLLRGCPRVMRQCPETHNRAAARRRMPDLSTIQQIHAVHAVKAGHLMAEALQMPSDCDTNVAAMPGDENAHATMISPRSN